MKKDCASYAVRSTLPRHLPRLCKHLYSNTRHQWQRLGQAETTECWEGAIFVADTRCGSRIRVDTTIILDPASGGRHID
uniref:Uncharacterized protein n=1 Tax=Physcomitrium patens TaxID=3218 RepID=A0A2K1K8I4_PHYPA|nr:hypothetical protein PHYPA_011979 [Physcomitrium patens]